MAGGWDKTRRRNGKSSKLRKMPENAARTHLSIHAMLGCVFYDLVLKSKLILTYLFVVIPISNAGIIAMPGEESSVRR